MPHRSRPDRSLDRGEQRDAARRAIRHLAPPGARSDKCDCDRERKAAKHRADLHVRLPAVV